MILEYDYDENGNRTAVRWTGGSTSATYDGEDHLVTSGDTTYLYSPNGELAATTLLGETTSYEYDAMHNLRNVTMSGLSIDYVLDGENRRVGKSVNGTPVQKWLYEDGLRIVAELDGSGALVGRFVYGSRANVPDYMVRGGVTYRIIVDHLSSPRFVVNTATGDIVQQLAYDVYGNVTLDTNPGFQPFGFAVGLYDRDTRLVHFGAREYDPSTGRWTTKDPILFGGRQANLYGYVANDPVNWVDPSGLVDVAFSAGFHVPVGPGIAVGPNIGSSAPNYFNNVVQGRGAPLRGDGITLDWAAGVIADVGVNVGFADLSGTGGSCAAPFSINLGLGTKGGVQIVPRSSIDPNLPWWNPAKYIDAISIGLGVAVPLSPVNVSASSGRVW